MLLSPQNRQDGRLVTPVDCGRFICDDFSILEGPFRHRNIFKHTEYSKGNKDTKNGPISHTNVEVFVLVRSCFSLLSSIFSVF